MLRPLRVNPYDRDILALALPALGTLAADPLVSLVDTAFVGRLGSVPLAALGVNTALFSLAFVVFNFLAYGTTPMVARSLGRGDREAAGRAVVQALTLALLAGGLAVAFLQLFAAPLLRLMGAGEELVGPALGYLRVRALAGPALLLITAGNGAFRGYQDTRTPFLLTLGLNLVNVALDPLFIFGFGWGLAGAAWATVVAQWAGALGFVWVLFARRRALGISVALPRFAELRPFVRVGWELLVRTAALLSTLTLATAVATRVGVLEVAAHQVAAQLWLFLALVVDALAVAAQALVARYRGAGQPLRARAVADRLLAWGFGVGLVLAAGFALFAPVLPRLFTDDPAVVRAVLTVFPFVALMQPLNALVFVWDGVLMGLEDFRYLALAMLVSAACGALVLLLVLPLGWGLTGVWWGVATLMGVRLVTLSWRYARLGR
ncbi:MATE family efflux transporter [Truepera radiovictrix]|uniref:MATE efflux family protein n=1 Tax=Truepera radiovictrix (strain DSM 17093 / CIP 108686 / LMG 22925 / RQ-24) TaxID=649638 RepID=D7CWB4_TRURR|nr:MATE family efflux transporter [Truepera radiovictrix]ADI16064.1 MATE efflux family protein [Truepera radiovictrix DSM 17093]WMT58309.1 MATE family efflux transporter [Truepera radiovictrix]